MSYESFSLICWIWIVAGLITFPFLLKVSQPYGRHSKTSWGPMINNRLGWFIMELPALAIVLYFVLNANNWQNQIVATASMLWGLHYIHRAIIFPLRIKTRGKKMPVIIVISAIFFNSVNGSINGYWLAHFVPETNQYFYIRLVAGVILFLTGFGINQYHDRILISLRKGSQTGYQIPYGGLFKWVSCPNFLGEIISWLGFFILTFGLPAFAFLIWTMVNLIPRAIDHHKWYLKEFAEYPKERKAIVPFIL